MNLDQLTFRPDEVKALSSIIGQELLEVRYDSWSAELLFKAIALSLTPDEIDIPTEGNPYGDIVTIRVYSRSDSVIPSEYSVLQDCGMVRNVWILESSVEIENPRQVEESELIAGVKVPRGLGWNNNIYKSTTHGNDGLYRATLGIQVETVNGIWLSLYTDAVGFFVLFHKGNELPEELNDKCEKRKIEE
ncbi:hypothetical protein [Pontibacter ruber]|uniref:Uncharacterized protein n=1 Tax=Pontibacter ruber TaxID=1343895 RepID=A0ABW5CXB8_9BACT|nr:hypothetical protein [Pontibacter ruber]